MEDKKENRSAAEAVAQEAVTEMENGKMNVKVRVDPLGAAETAAASLKDMEAAVERLDTEENNEAVAMAATHPSAVCELAVNELVMLNKLDKAVSTNDTLEDLQRALTYEAIFSTLLQQKVRAMKRDCEERKRAKRLKRKSIGRIFFSKKLFGGAGSRKNSACRSDLAADMQQQQEELQLHRAALQQQAKRQATKTPKTAERDTSASASVATAMRYRYADDIEVAAASKGSQRSQRPGSQSRAAAPGGHADDSVASTLSNSSEKQGAASALTRHLLVRAQTHTPAELVRTSSSSADSQDGGSAPHTHRSLGNGKPPSLLERSYDTASLDNGAATRIHTSTMADDSLTSPRDSIESLSFASSRCTVSFGGTEIIPEDTESLLYERARVAKRLRILEAKSISAQCSPIFPRHPSGGTVKAKSTMPTPVSPLSKLVPAAAPPVRVSTDTAKSGIAVATVSTMTPTAAMTAPPLLSASAGSASGSGNGIGTSSAQTQTKPRFLPNQVSYTESLYSAGGGGGGVGVTDLEAAYSRYFSRQNTSEESANLTVSTLLNQSDSLSLHAPVCASGGGYGVTTAASPAAAAGRTFSLGDRYKSKSTSLLVASRPPAAATATLLAPPRAAPSPGTIPTAQLQQLHITSNISYSAHLLDSTKYTHIPAPDGGKSAAIALSAAHANGATSASFYPVITSSSAAATALESMSIATIRNDGVAGGLAANGAIVASGATPGDTAKLNRMTSTSTGSSVAPTGCCATTKSSTRDREKQRFKPSWPSGQSGSDDEYRQRKRKYKRYHRCSDPVLVYPTPSGLQHCILSMPPNDPVQFSYNEDFAYDVQLQMESDKNDDLEEIVPSDNRRHRRHRHHKHKKRHRHKKPKILVQDLETRVVKVIDPDDLPQRARWTIIATACLLLLMCLMLVGITLRMAPIIDDMASEEERVIIARENGKDVIFCTFYITAVALTSFTALLAPFIIVALMHHSDGEQQLELLPPLRASYFLDYTKPLNYALVHAWNCVCIYAVMHISVGIDGLFSWLISNIIAQFRILQLRLKQVAALNSASDVATAHIVACVHLHRRILNTADELNTVFGAIICVKFTISCLQICVLAYQVARGGETIDAIFHCLFFISVATQLMVYCKGGQLLKDESELIATAIYVTFPWYNYRVSTQKLLLYSMARSQRACSLSAMFFTVDLSLFSWVFRTACSFIALLWNLDAKKSSVSAKE